MSQTIQQNALKPPNNNDFVTSVHSSFFRSGARFRGTQKSDRSVYNVTVEIQSVDFENYKIIGLLKIQGLAKNLPSLTTLFEGEIVGPKYSFYTCRSEWGSSDKIDLDHWSKFEGFKHVNIENLAASSQSSPLVAGNYLFMRWKEISIIPDEPILNSGLFHSDEDEHMRYQFEQSEKLEDDYDDNEYFDNDKIRQFEIEFLDKQSLGTEFLADLHADGNNSSISSSSSSSAASSTESSRRSSPVPRSQIQNCFRRPHRRRSHVQIADPLRRNSNQVGRSSQASTTMTDNSSNRQNERLNSADAVSYAGFYYICYDQKNATIDGLYYHKHSERFQRLFLNYEHTPYFQTFSFC